MNNTNVQVSPGNRVDFSKIRKAQQGIKIPKFLTPATKIGNRKNTLTQDWWIAHNNANIDLWTKIAQEHPEMTIDELNNFIAQNHNLYLSTGYTGDKAIKGEGVRQYQRDYHRKYGFGNTDAFWNGWSNDYNHESLNTGDAKTLDVLQFNGDDYFGELTNRRVANYFNDEELARANEAIKSRGWHWELADYNDQDNRSGVGGRKFYKLVLSKNSGEKQEEDLKDDLIGDQRRGRRHPLEFNTLPARKGTPWTDWIPLSAMLANNLMTNIRNFGNAIKKRFSLREALYLQGKVTNNYAARLMRELQAAEARSRAQQQLGSDIVQNLNYLNAVEHNLLDLENQNAIDKTEEFNRTSQELQTYSNLNKYQAVDTNNYNLAQIAATLNNIIAERNKLNIANAAELNSYAGLMYGSHALWLQNERQEDARYNREVAGYDYQNGLTQAYATSGLKALEEVGIKASQAFQNFKAYLSKHTEIGGVTADGKITDESVLAYILANPEKPIVKLLQELFNKEKSDAEARYMRSQSQLAAEKIRRNIRIDNTSSNQGTRFGDRYIRHSVYEPRNPLYVKSGGKMKARFIDYMNHYQKQLQFDRSETRKVQEGLQKKLARDMGLLDKETLMLLKLAFS